MSVDARARAATQELHDVMVARVPTASGVARRGVVRRRTRFAGVVVATVVAVAGGLLVGGRNLSQQPAPPPVAPHPRVTGMACQLEGMSCVDDRLRAAGPLAVPVSLIPAPGVNTDDISPGSLNLEVRRTTGGPYAGMTVFEEPHAVDGDRDHLVPALDRAPAEEVASWLASRPFLETTAPRPVEIDGREAWRVEARLRPGSSLRSFANAYPAALTFLNGVGFGTGGSTAASEHLAAAYYYLLDVPGHGLVLVWVWTWDGTQRDLDAMDAMVATLRFG